MANSVSEGCKKILGRRRDKIEIIAAILTQSQKPRKKTHIMYGCDLSFSQLKRYLSFLRKKAFIEKKNSSGSTTYQTTKEGERLLKQYFNIATLLQSSAKQNS